MIMNSEEEIKVKEMLEKIALQEQINDIERQILEIFKQMKMTELETLKHKDELKKDYPKEYAAFNQAVLDMQGYVNDNSIDDMKYYVGLLTKTLDMHKETLKTYDKFKKIYELTYGKDEKDYGIKEKELQDKLKDALIDEVIAVVYPNITDFLKSLIKESYQNRSIEELEDIKRVFSEDLGNGSNSRN